MKLGIEHFVENADKYKLLNIMQSFGAQFKQNMGRQFTGIVNMIVFNEDEKNNDPVFKRKIESLIGLDGYLPDEEMGVKSGLGFWLTINQTPGLPMESAASYTPKTIEDILGKDLIDKVDILKVLIAPFGPLMQVSILK